MRNYELHRESYIDAAQPPKFKLTRDMDKIRVSSWIQVKNEINFSLQQIPLPS